MSRTFRKYIRHGICTGSNTEWYRARRRWLRKRNRQELWNAIKHFDIEEAAERLSFTWIPKRDGWCEPTDGVQLYTPDEVNDRSIEIEDKGLYFSDFYVNYYTNLQRQMKHYHYDKWYYKRNKNK